MGEQLPPPPASDAASGGLTGQYAQTDAMREHLHREIEKAGNKHAAAIERAVAEKAAAAETAAATAGEAKKLAAERAAAIVAIRRRRVIPAGVGAESPAKKREAQGSGDTPPPKTKTGCRR